MTEPGGVRGESCFNEAVGYYRRNHFLNEGGVTDFFGLQ